MVEKPPASAGDLRDAMSVPGSGSSLGGEDEPTSVFLPGEPHGQRSLADHSPWGRKELDMTEAT